MSTYTPGDRVIIHAPDLGFRNRTATYVGPVYPSDRYSHFVALDGYASWDYSEGGMPMSDTEVVGTCR